MAYDQVIIGTLAVGGGAIVAAQDIPGIDTLIDKAGLGAIAVVLLWWMLTSFSKRLDRLTDSIDKLAEKEKE